MQSVIFYAGRAHTPGAKLFICGGVNVWVRTKVLPVGIDEALARAHPLEGETVLNTVPLDAVPRDYVETATKESQA